MSEYVTDVEDHTFGLLLRSIAPMVMSGAASHGGECPRLRGVVRASESHARIVVSSDLSMSTGVAFQFPLRLESGDPLPAGAAIDWVRESDSAGIRGSAEKPDRGLDSHGNAIVDAIDAGFDPHRETALDHGLFGLLSMLIHGGGYPWFEDTYTSMGFMLRPSEQARLYVSLTGRRTVWEADIPLRHPRTHRPVDYGSLPQELASLLRDGERLPGKTVTGRDDYCSEVFDMSEWFGAA
ncbi:hypothetical protein OWR29_41525 [Actinoplanes sp. Pm04-4]|uniref:Uncharacterized protein n=1 Tax=Paractinoplanes pyxinae TaxID=2997416 RepID=A0ABT4BDC9_9ACTN|nr:hypothetical protein [Actinoplanes pyxinae]MCY1144518.1 hypothetical protein [Actinoplanes pyxinae]